jgi:large subunit ribosomal protein L24
VKLVCPSCKKATRVGYKIIEGKKYRICKKCGQEI